MVEKLLHVQIITIFLMQMHSFTDNTEKGVQTGLTVFAINRIINMERTY
jgi:hypothetical protein